MDRDSLKALILKHEGIELKPYFDCCGKFFRECVCEKQGKLTIGIGRNIEDNGITNAEANYLVENDLGRVVSECRENFAWFNSLDDSRQNAICDMNFNMGLRKLGCFVKMLGAIASGDFKEAANQMKASLWSGEVGQRAVDDADLMEKGNTIN